MDTTAEPSPLHIDKGTKLTSNDDNVPFESHRDVNACPEPQQSQPAVIKDANYQGNIGLDQSLENGTHSSQKGPEKSNCHPSNPSFMAAAVETATNNEGDTEMPEPVEVVDPGPATGPSTLPPCPDAPPAAQPQQDQPQALGQEPSATPATLQVAAEVASDAPLSPLQEQAIADLEMVVTKVSQLDVEGWFQLPVRETDAPNYYSIIKQPMCFQTMRTKIKNKQYVNWQEIVRDFDLICTNAMKYNQKRSRVHRQALVMLRAGRKQLAEVELQGRRAISLLHPAGPAIGDNPDNGVGLPSSLLRTGTLGLQATLGFTPQSGTGTQPMDLEYGEDGDAQSIQPDGDPGYSSYDETDDEDRYAKLPKMSLENVARASSVQSVLVEPLHASRNAVDINDMNAQGPLMVIRGASSDKWKTTRRDAQWRMRWIESRIKLLASQRQRYHAALHQLQVSDTEQQQRQRGVEPAVEAVDGDQEMTDLQETQRKEPPKSGQKPLWKYKEHNVDSTLQMPELLLHPFFSDHSVVCKRLNMHVGASGRMDDILKSVDFPARVHAAVALLGQQLSGLRYQLVGMKQPDNDSDALYRTMGRLGSGGRSGRGRGRGRGSRGGGGGGVPRGLGSGGGLARQPSAFYNHHREEEALGLRLLKRRRTQDSELNEFVAPGLVGTPKFVERVQVKNIDTPKVRTLPSTELKKRLAIVNAYGVSIKPGKLDTQKQKEALAAINALCPEESSDEEDTSDEAFAQRHAVMEVAEKARYESLIKDKVRARKEQQERGSLGDGGASKPPRPPRTGSDPTLNSGGGNAARVAPIARLPSSTEPGKGNGVLSLATLAANTVAKTEAVPLNTTGKASVKTAVNGKSGGSAGARGKKSSVARPPLAPGEKRPRGRPPKLNKTK